MGLKESFIYGTKSIGRTLSKNAPTIMVIGGTVAVIAAGVLACKTTATKLNVVLDEHRNKLAELRDIRDGKTPLDSEEAKEIKDDKEYKKYLTSVYFQTICKLAKAYAPALILAALGTTSILTGHKVLSKRCLAAVAECYAAQNTLTEYRKRVAGRIGDEAEKLLYVGGEKQVIEDQEVDPETGEVRATESHEAIVGGFEKLPHYTYIVSSETVHDWALSNSDANFRRLLENKVRDANTYLTRHDQVVLGDIMRHFWKDDYLRKHTEIFNHGWWKDNPLCEPLPEVYPINITITMLSAPGQPRKYAVTFENVQGDISRAMDVVKMKDKADKSCGFNPLKPRRDIKAQIKEATA